ncbi:hypothetical protein BGX34_009332 [Mortierella sp. NVP85]|nr:hypothetical protein BGX34_009332 [Mortierella sp. NVP85]
MDRSYTDDYGGGGNHRLSLSNRKFGGHGSNRWDNDHGGNESYRNDGHRNEGYRSYEGGYRNEGNRNEGNRNEGNRNEGNRNEGNRSEGYRNEGGYRNDRNDRNEGYQGYRGNEGYRNNEGNRGTDGPRGYKNASYSYRDDGDHKDTGGRNPYPRSNSHSSQQNSIDNDQSPHRGGDNYRSRYSQQASEYNTRNSTGTHKTNALTKVADSSSRAESAMREVFQKHDRPKSYAERFSGTEVVKKFREMSTQTTEDEVRGELIVHDSTWNGIRVMRADKQQSFGMKRGGALTMPELKPSVPPSLEVTNSLLNTVVTGHSSSPAKTSQQRYPSDEYNNGHPDRGNKDTTSYSMRGKTSDKASVEATQDIPTSKWLDAAGGSSSFKSSNGANPRSERKDPASSWNSDLSTTATSATGAGWGDSQATKAGELDWSQGVAAFPSDMKPSTMPVTAPSEPDPFSAAPKSGALVKSSWGKEQGDEGYGQQKSDYGWSKKGENAGGRRPSDSHSHSSHDQRGGRFTFSSTDGGSRFPGPGGHPQDKRSMNSEDRYSRRDQGNDNNSDSQRNRRNDGDSYSAGGYGQRWGNNNHNEQNQRGSQSGAISSSTNLGGRKPFKDDSERGSAVHAWAAAASQQASKPGGNRGTETSSPTNTPLATASDFASFMQAAKSFVPAPSTGKKDPSSTAEGGHADSTHDGVDEGHSVVGREQGLDDQAQPKQNDLEPEQEYEKRALEHDDKYPVEEGLKTEEAEEEEEERLERRPSKPSIANFDISKEPSHHTSSMDQAGVQQEDSNLLSFEDQSRSTSEALTGPDDADNLPKESESPAPCADDYVKDLVAPAADSDIHLKDSEAPTDGLEAPALSADDHAASPEAPTTNTDDHGNDLDTPSPITDNHPKDLEASATNTDSHSKDLETSVLGTDDHPKDLEASATDTDNHPKDLKAPSTSTDDHPKDLDAAALDADGPPKSLETSVSADDHQKDSEAPAPNGGPKESEAPAPSVDDHLKGPENLSVTGDLSSGPDSADDATVEANPKIGQDANEAREAQEAQEQ